MKKNKNFSNCYMRFGSTNVAVKLTDSILDETATLCQLLQQRLFICTFLIVFFFLN